MKKETGTNKPTMPTNKDNQKWWSAGYECGYGTGLYEGGRIVITLHNQIENAYMVYLKTAKRGKMQKPQEPIKKGGEK